MADKRDVATSKFLSMALRHDPGAAGLVLDPAGWAEIDEVLAGASRAGVALDRESLELIVATSDKKRFTFSVDGCRIRAAQGHSVSVELGLEPSTPPDRLYHGTTVANLDAIHVEGLKPMARRQVHLSSDRETALRVGGRHGKPVVLVVDAAAMAAEGHLFFQAENGVWLTDRVPPSALAIA